MATNLKPSASYFGNSNRSITRVSDGCEGFPRMGMPTRHRRHGRSLGVSIA